MSITLPKSSEILKRAWKIFKQKLKILIQIELVPLVAAVPILILFGAAGLLGESGGKSPELPFILIMILVGTFAFVLQIWSQISMIFAIDSTGPVDFRNIFRQSRPLILPYLGAALLTGLIVFGGLVLLIIPGIIFALWYYFGIYTVVLEGKRGMDALRTSKSYVKGNIGQIFHKFAFLVLAAFVVLFIPNMIFQALHLQALGSIYGAFASVIFSPVAMIYCYLVYRAVRDSKQSVSQPSIIPASKPPASASVNGAGESSRF